MKHPNSAKDDNGRLLVGAAVGVSRDMQDRLKALVQAKVDVVVVDTAHGHSKGVLEAVYHIKEKYPELQVIIGNVATAEAAEDLIKAGGRCYKGWNRPWLYMHYKDSCRDWSSLGNSYI